MPLTLPQNCSNCQHFDGDIHCARPYERFIGNLIKGQISQPTRVVCDLHEPKTPEDQ